MGDIKLVEQMRLVRWVECKREGCEYTSEPTMDMDKAQSDKDNHYTFHAQQKLVAERIAVEELTQLLRTNLPGMAPIGPDGVPGDYRTAICSNLAHAMFNAGWRKTK